MQNKQTTEILAAAPDHIVIAAGARLERPHPLAEALTLRRIAEACALASRPARPFETDVAVMSRGIHTIEFSKALADGARKLTLLAYESQAAEHLAFTTVLEVQDFKPIVVPAVDACGVELELLGQNAEIARGTAEFIQAAGHSGTVQLHTFARMVGLTRDAVINDQLGAFAAFVGGLGGSAARLEAQLVAQALEANPVMDDGAVAFAADHDNIEAEALSAASLGRAMALLRNQKTAAGQLAGLRARHLVTSPSDEFTARVLLKDAGLDATVAVSVLANLPAGRWYLMADKQAAPVVATLQLAGASRKVFVEQQTAPPQADGAFVKVRCDTGAVLLRRTGIVRGGTV